MQQTAEPGGKRRLRLRLRSPRGAGEAVLYIPEAARIESATVEGRPVTFSHFSQTTFLRIAPLPPQGIEFAAVLGESAPQEWYVVDETPGLPPGGEALLAARPATAVTIQDGDVTLVSRKVRI